MTAIHPIVSATFKISCRTEQTESVYLIGSIDRLKSWDVSAAIKLRLILNSSKYSLWQCNNIPLPSNTSIEYKFFKRGVKGDIVWEWDEEELNRNISLSPGTIVEITQTFGVSTNEVKVIKKIKYIENDKKDSLKDFSLTGIPPIPIVHPYSSP